MSPSPKSIRDELLSFCKELPKHLVFTKGKPGGFSSISITNILLLTTKFKYYTILQKSYIEETSIIIKSQNSQENNLAEYDLSFFDLDTLEQLPALYILLFILNTKEGLPFVRNAGDIILVPDTDADYRNENYSEIEYEPDLFSNIIIKKIDNFLHVKPKKVPINAKSTLASNQQQDPEVSTPTYKIR